MISAVTQAVTAPRIRAPYENWRPPVIGVSLLVPVGADRLAVADLRGMLMLPGGGVHERQRPEDAAHRVLSGPRAAFGCCAASPWTGHRRGAGRSSRTYWRLRR
ncbi:hypothetical protein O1M63_07285 [Streptomyces mirabilis]|nr:hypothetical protein [Streptomyces mirabilis]